MFEDFSPEDFDALISAAPLAEKAALLDVIQELNTRKERAHARKDYIAFVNSVWPDFISGAHHRRIAKLFEAVARGEKKRIIINLGPRHTKSEFASYLLPAWFLGQFPKKKIMQISNTAELAEGFGRKVRNLVNSDEYRRIFPEVELRTDSKAAGRWNTNFNGEYFAAGVGGTVTGRGADLLIIDDPHSEGEAVIAQFNPEVYDKVFSWYSSGPRQRLQPGGAIIIVMTRWSMRDLTGQILEHSAMNGGDKWEVVEFPAILPSGKPLWPEFWNIEELEAVRNEIPASKWQAQYQQQPTSEATAIIKREWWQEWKEKDPPDCDFLLMSMDTAFEKKTSADYSAIVIFGVWNNPEDGDQPNLILLEAWRERLEFPDLKQRTLEFYQEWEPDGVIVEKKASGAPLIYELRRMGIPVQEFTPSRGQDKISRLNAVADIFASGKVWAPLTRWADEVINEIASFPAGRNDDFVDACFVKGTLILMQDGTEKPIEEVKIGEYVITPKGPKRVLEAACTGYKQTYSVAGLVGSAEHPVFTLHGWIPLLWLQKDDIILSLITSRGEVCVNEKIESRLGLMGFCIKSIVTDLIMNVLGGIIFYIGTRGFTIMERFQKGIIYTTKMRTPVITLLKTLRCLLRKIIGNYIKKPLLSAVHHLSTWYIWKKLDHLLLNGMGLKKGKNGIKPTPSKQFMRLTAQNLIVKLVQWRKCVSFASKYLYPKTLSDKLLALKNAIMLNIMKNGHSEERRTPLKEIASIALNHTRLCIKNKGSVVPSVSKLVQMPVQQQIEKVYNLTVEDTPMYYANGILVHNCTLALARFRSGGFIGSAKDKDIDEDSWMYKKRANYY